ncbi:MAG: truB [Planctomycetaceae bacterium]|nr:truB [Planctomycetaceae bacterium]
MPSPPLSGLLNIYKPAGWSSRDVVNRVERLVKPSKAGHAGTLDPLAEGVLVVAVGAATRLISGAQEREKEYHAVFQLGCRSDTDDSTGEITTVEVSQHPARTDIEALLPQFIGNIWQVPPQFSAVHIDGQRAYALARQGQAVDIAPRQVHVSRLEIVDYAWPKLELLMECGSGTYVRSIGRDLGELLGCGAIMTALLRSRIGPFHSTEAIAIDDLQKENVAAHLQSPVRAVEHWPQHRCSALELWDVAHGRMIVLNHLATSSRVALLTPNGELAALGEMRTLGRVRPTQVFIDRYTLTNPTAESTNSDEVSTNP